MRWLNGIPPFVLPRVEPCGDVLRRLPVNNSNGTVSNKVLNSSDCILLLVLKPRYVMQAIENAFIMHL